MIPVVLLVVAMLIPAAQVERVPDSGVVNGVPQGIFVARSLLTGRTVCLLFLSGGRITRFVPKGGLESFDWNRHRAAHGPDTGTWEVRNGQLAVHWGDGGVHQGPITVRPDGIEFYGKRYSKPVAVTLAAIAGRWESSRGTAIAGGAGINKVSELVIAADGRYQWASTVGGVVEGRAVASDRAMSGTVTVRGLTIIFKSDAGTTSSHTLLPAAGQPVNAFSVDSDMFTRSGPAPETIASQTSAQVQSGASPAPANSYQGLAFALPAGWTTSTVQGRFVAAPPNVTAQSLVFVVLSGAEKVTGSLEDWLRGKMAGDANGLKVLQAGPPTRSKSGSLDVLSAGRTVQDPRGATVLQIYFAITDGTQSGLAMVATNSQDALQAQMPGVQALFQSLRFGAAAESPSGAKPAGTPAGRSTNPAPSANKTAITAADLAGKWEHNDAAHTQYRTSSGGNAGSSTIAYGDGYTFKADGTFTYSFTGMYNSVYIRESDSGTWGFEGGFLVIRGRTRATKSYQLIQFHMSPDGTASMTLLDRSYPPTDSNINAWGEKYVKKGKSDLLEEFDDTQ